MAVAVGMLLEVVLMVFFGEIEGGEGCDFDDERIGVVIDEFL